MTASAPAAAARTAIPVRHLMDLEILFEPVPVFATPTGTRMVLAVRSGRFSGPGIEGDVLPGSADWLVVGTDRIGRIDVRAVLRTSDGAHLHMTNTGRVSLGDSAARFLAGEVVTAEEAYIRTSPLFDTDAPAHRHLNGVVTVAYCDIALTGISYHVYAVD